MILRRISDAFRKQDWFTVAVETLIVVFGVFMGLQVNNWNASKAESRLAADYVKRLTRDLNQDLANLNAQVVYYNAVLESVQAADELLSMDEPDPRALVVSAYRATELSYAGQERATWDQIVSSGHLTLLPPSVGESGLSQYYAFDTAKDNYQLGSASAYRRTVREIIPVKIQIAIREKCSDVRDDKGNIRGFTETFTETCELDVDPAALQAASAALQNDPDVAATLRYQYTFAVSATLNLGNALSKVQDSLAALGAARTPEAAP